MGLRPLSPELAEKARLELNEDPSRLEADLQHMKDWIAKQPHLRARTDDQWLIAFLRGCKYSLEKAKEKFDLTYSLRTTAPELFSLKYNEPRFNEILESGSFLVLPKTAKPDAPRIIILRSGVVNPQQYTLPETLSVLKVIEQILFVDDDNLVVAGVEAIFDMDRASMAHFLQLTPTLMKKVVVSGQDAAPIRLKGAHYLNTPPVFETIFNAMKPLLNKKNQNRLFVHNKNYEAMYKIIPKEILPAEYGGTGGTIKEITDAWKAKIEEYSGWLDEGEAHGTDEGRRPGAPRTAAEMFGVEGSFRQLQFD